MRAFSLFAGIGGFDLALERNGIEVVGQAEIEPHCRDVLERHFPSRQLVDDVRAVGKLDVDLVCGGFPCQDISAAGKHAGLAGERSGLWWEFARILEQSQPRYCIVENVAGLLSSNRGRDLGAILGTLGEIGYGFAYRVLDAQWFGVPQRRRRVFIVGCLGDARRAGEILLEPEGGEWNPPTRENSQASSPKAPGDGSTLLAETGIVRSLTATMGKSMHDLDGAEAGWLLPVPLIAFHCKQDPISSTEVYPAMSGGGMLGIVQPDIGVRRLMPIECERLQGFPDNWTAGHPDTHRYRMLGNAVAVPVVEWIARRLVGQD